MKNGTAIVIGYKGTNSTGLIRSLGKAGFHVTFASSYSRIESKYTTDYLYLPEEPEQRLHTLCEYIKQLESKPALFTGDDLSISFLEENREVLLPICYCPNAGGKLHELSDKTVMAEIANSVGLNVPEYSKVKINQNTSCPLDFPVIVKPYAGYAGSKSDIKICRSSDGFSDSMAVLKSAGYAEVMVQHLLESDDQQDLCLMGYSLDNGTVRIPCTIRKIRSYPLNRGSLSYGHVERFLSDECIRKLQEFVKQTGYIGIFDIDIMISDGIPYFIEINYRNGQNGYVSTAAGFNIPGNWFHEMRGETIKTDQELSEIYYMDEHCDYRHVREGNVTWKQWVKERKRASVFAMYCPGDQRPFWRQYVRFPERWKRKIRKLLHIGVDT